MGLFNRDRKANIDRDLLAQARGCRMSHYTRDEAFEALRDKYQVASDARIREAIDYVYDGEDDED